MLEEDGDQPRRKSGDGPAEDDNAATVFFTVIFLMIIGLIFFTICLMCCFCSRKCINSFNLRLLPDESNAQCTTVHPLTLTECEQGGRPKPESCSHCNVNPVFATTEPQAQGNHTEQIELAQGITQENMNNQNVSKTNQTTKFSFGDHSKNFPAKGFKNNSLTLPTIIESKQSNNSSPSHSEEPPVLPRTSPPPLSAEFPAQSNIPPTLNSTAHTSSIHDTSVPVVMIDQPLPTCCYPRQSDVLPCITGTPLPFQGRLDDHPTSGPSQSHRTCFDPTSLLNARSLFFNSQINLARRSPVPLLPQAYVTYNFLPQYSHTNQSSELPEYIEMSQTNQIRTPGQKTWLWTVENSETTEIPERVNDSQSISEQDSVPSTSETPDERFVPSTPSTSTFVHGSSSPFPLGSTSRLQYYRGHDISTNDMIGEDSDVHDQPFIFCSQCHLCTLICECTSSDENGDFEESRE